MDTCYAHSYKPTMSFSPLSPYSVNRFLKDHGTLLKQPFDKAQEIRQRSLARTYGETVNKWMNVIHSYQNLFNITKEFIFDDSTSYISQMNKASWRMKQDLTEDVRTIFKDMPKYKKSFLGVHSQLYHSLSRTLHLSADYLRDLENIIYSRYSTSDDFSVDGDWIADTFVFLTDLLPHAHNSLLIFTEHSDALSKVASPRYEAFKDFIVPRHIANQGLLDKCMGKYESIQKAGYIHKLLVLIEGLENTTNTIHDASYQFVDDLDIEWFNYTEGVAETIDCIEMTSLSSFVCRLQLFEYFIAQLDPCLFEYENFLNDFDIWFAKIDSYDNDNLRYDDKAINKDYEEMIFNMHDKWLGNLFNQFITGSKTKLELVGLVNGAEMATILSDTSKAVDSIKENIFIPMKNDIIFILDNIISRYQYTMLNALNMTSYLNETQTPKVEKSNTGNSNEGLTLGTMEKRARQLYLWRKPYIEWTSNSVIKYQYTDEHKSWPKGKQLKEFVNHLSSSVIQMRVDHIRDSMFTMLVVLDDAITKLHSDFKEAVANLSKEMTEYDNANKLSTDFIENNFIGVTFYFDELKTETVTQTRAYDIPSFFSDFGGYMGLLLGASVISIFELLDFILYNTSQKFCKKKENKVKSMDTLPK